MTSSACLSFPVSPTPPTLQPTPDAQPDHMRTSLNTVCWTMCIGSHLFACFMHLLWQRISLKTRATRALTTKKSSHTMTIMKKYVVRVTSRFWGNSPPTNNIWKPWCVQWSENITTWGRGWSHSHQSRARPHPTYIPHSNLYIHPTYILLLTFVCSRTLTYNTLF